jgi:pyrimidine deaminase RibD-like protein
MRHRVGAVVVRGGQVISKGYNRGRRHAEISALARLWPSERVDTVVYVARPLYEAEYGLARPCEDCLNAMRRAGVKKVFFSAEEGWECLRLR